MPGGEYAVASGTSISTAFVAGTAALLRSLAPQDTPDDVDAHLLASAQSLDDENPEYAGLLGAGLLDVAAALSHADVAAPNSGLDGADNDMFGGGDTPQALPGLRGGPVPSPELRGRFSRIMADLLVLLGEE